jgi:hypothetical protein
MPGFLQARQVLWRILYALAFVVLSVSSHHAAAADGAAGASYRLPDGSYASLCEPGGDGKPSTPGDHCRTCLIAQPHGLAAPELLRLDAPVFTLLGLNTPAPRRDFTPKPTFRRMASRGPPSAA